MNDFLTKLSIYDQLGYLIVGGLLYIFLLYDQTYLDINLNEVSKSPFSVALVAYFLGHIVQALARCIKSPVEYKISQNTLRRIQREFKLPTGNTKQAFKVCYLYALTVDKTGHVEIMNARYGLYRGWAIVLGLQAIFYLWRFVYCFLIDSPDYWLLYWFFIYLLLAVLIFGRAAAFYKKIGEKTINTFLLHKPVPPHKPAS